MDFAKIFKNNEEWIASKLKSNPDYPKDRHQKYCILDVLIVVLPLRI
jgi:hypothetical protein